MIDSASLLADLKRQLSALEKDLRAQSEDPSVAWSAQLREEHAEATRRKRTALTWSAWRDGEVSQAAVAWLVATTFVRFCEDNHLLDGHHGAGLGAEPVWLAGPGDRTARAVENQQAHYEQHPTDNSRDWLLRAFAALADLPAGRALVDRGHNPVWRAPISAQAADALLEFWRRADDDGASAQPTLRHDFTDPRLDTRFLGDLYQDLSEYAKKTFALLQTPVFVEEFILDRTLTPAIEEFGLSGLKLIDPTCGSGHFLLGAFARLDEAWREHAPALAPRERVQRALDSVHGVDLNPFAVAIARFRLTVAALQAAGDKTLTAAPAYRFHLAIGDSLLGEQGIQGELDLLSEEDEEPFAYAAEDLGDYRGILESGQYHVVVGNPPYITPKDKALNEAYRRAYPDSCGGKYALSAPFMELFFRLALREGAGFVGKITSNSFMKREFGKKVIENFLSSANLNNPVDLREVIDTSGAYIPGHGTPTVILVGRRRRPVGGTVRAVLGVRGEPGQPTDPSRGLVWSEIADHIGDDSFDGSYVTVTDVPRETLSSHPWSLSGGGASAVFEALGEARSKLSSLGIDIGMTALTGEDETFTGPARIARRLEWDPNSPVLVEGEQVRDYSIASSTVSLLAVDLGGHRLEPSRALGRWFWRNRAVLQARLYFGQRPEERGIRWFDHAMFFAKRHETPLSIAFAFVATHNHFVLDRGGKVFNRSAPVIKLPADATEDDHLGLLAVLNSSTACFWLKQVSHNKGGPGGGSSKDEKWRDFYEFTGTKLQQYPLPSDLPVLRGRVLDSLAQEATAVQPDQVLAGERGGEWGHSALSGARARMMRIRARMVFEQEELDWDIYRRYGLIEEDLTYDGPHDSLLVGERAFEISLARAVAAGTADTRWFREFCETQTTRLPSSWPADYKALVERRLALIESDPRIRLLESPDFKRPWSFRSWEDQEREALQNFALDRLENPELWRDAHGAVTLSVAQLADKVRGDSELREVLALLAGSPQFDLVQSLTALVKDEAVPYVAAWRFKESGMTKFREWQEVWELQRREDLGEKVEIPVPPKYAQADFRSTAAWRARGKLDVPKERFIAYPGVVRAGDSTPVLGWAGWDHADQGLALARVYLDMKSLGAEREDLVPILAGLVELEPWLHQWHSDPDPARGGSPAQAVTGMVDSGLAELALTRRDVAAWRPAAATRGRRPAASRSTKEN